MTWDEDWRAEDEVTKMALVGRRDGRNFGHGRQLSYAGPQALKDMFGGEHYGTVKAHSDRWQAFVKWCRSEQGPDRRCALQPISATGRRDCSVGASHRNALA